MNVTIYEPALVQFIADEVRSGRFGTADEVVAFALTDLIKSEAADVPDEEGFDDETEAALDESLDQAARGQTMTVDEAAARLGLSVERDRSRTGAA
jgi:Arc/MetJ-type ribon-helix-helix transcriptional regulator